MVEKLFREKPYLEETEAKVTSVNGNRITLDKTIFFAFTGGQASDSGIIGGIPVAEAKAQEKEIFYTLEKEQDFKEGDIVKIKIDAEKRSRIRRLHSAAHIVYMIFTDKTGIKKLIGSNVDEKKSRVDYEYPESISPMLIEIEEKVNEFLARGYEIKTYPSKENPDRWVWECNGVKMPCGGTHVRNTFEIGKIRLKRKNIGAGKERIEIMLV
ncbi:alanyl-tRNA editing protein [Candidatus Micrarchaeota archaeon]|nr:alanyl-tRNA editing protein [Candidatus Micrarchaeota archaeon]